MVRGEGVSVSVLESASCVRTVPCALVMEREGERDPWWR